MYIEFNISKNGKHYFATHERSFNSITEKEVKEVYDDLKKRFPESEGFEIQATRYALCGERLKLKS